MKYKTMYGMHELRMWVTTLVTGACAASAITAAHPEIKEAIKNKVGAIKAKTKGLFKKKEEPRQ